MTKKKTEIPNLMSLEEFIKAHSSLVEMQQMRRIILNERKNGAVTFIHRIGRRIFINVDKFFEWTQRKR